MKSIHISDVYKLDDAKQKIDNLLLKYYQRSRFQKSILDSVLINAASQSLQINLNNEYIVINYLILAILKQNIIQNSENILHSVQLGLSAFHCLFELPELNIDNSIRLENPIHEEYDQSITQLLILTNLSESFRCILDNDIEDKKQHNKIVIFIMKRYSYINQELQKLLMNNVVSICSNKDKFCSKDISIVKSNVFNYFLKYIIEITYIYSKQTIQDSITQKQLNQLGDVFVKLYNTVYHLDCDDMSISTINNKLKFAELLECNFKLLKMEFLEKIKSLEIYNELFDKILVIMEKNLLENIRFQFR